MAQESEGGPNSRLRTTATDTASVRTGDRRSDVGREQRFEADGFPVRRDRPFPHQRPVTPRRRDPERPNVELRGIEPLTSSMPWKRSTN